MSTVETLNKHQPLDRLQLEISVNGKMHQELALSAHWVQKREWMHFIPFTRLPLTDVGAKDRWLFAATELSQDLHWLLTLSHHCFWSQLVFDPGARGALLSYLEFAPRSYDRELAMLEDEQKNILSHLHALVFRVYMRITTQQESDNCFQSNTGFGKMLYDNYLMDVPTILDLCLLYGHGNTATALAKSLNQVLEVQPKYTGDLEASAHMLTKALKELETYFISQPKEASKDREFTPIPLKNQAPGSKGDMNGSQLEDLIIFLLDIVTSVSTLLQLLSSACKALHNTRIETEIARFYELVVPEIYRNILSLPDDSQCNELQRKMDTARYHLLSIAKATLATKMTAIIEIDDQNEAAVLADEYVAVLSECLAEPHFIRDYHVLCPIDQDLDILKQKCPDELDATKYSFLLESVFSCFDVPKRSELKATVQARLKQKKAIPQNIPVAGSSKSNGYADNNTEAEVLVLESLVSEIQAILPNLGAGFVQQCLRHYNFNKEHVISAILDNELPAALKDLDRTMPLSVYKPDGTVVNISIPERLNVFDHDEFDIMSRDHIDMSRVYRGKKRSKHKNLTQLLNDKSDIQEVRDIYQRYGTIQEIEYDDEYDDTYDEVNDVSIDEEDPLTERRPFVIPRVLAAQQTPAKDDGSDEYEEENARAVAPRDQLDFAQDPALLRAQAEQRRASKMSHKPQPSTKDVVGNAKGKGQDAKVVLNRQRKNTHKSSQANHNRRSGAQHKMRQGMIPS